MVGGGFGGPLQRLYDMCGRGQIGVTDTEADDVDALLLNLPFEAVEFREKIRPEKGGQPRAGYPSLEKESALRTSPWFITHLLAPPKATRRACLFHAPARL